ncbi:hypothetical protein wTpre_436 [Wolbachia endosymbiont of Trichogramma pretiosum]|nr:hypothetical protein wTpre_436 [Wolbachia endosymbiont of Trichogramma pretiosum]
MRDSVLKRYLLAYIKENGSENGIQEFLLSPGMKNIENWSYEIFKDVYKEFRQHNPTNGSDRYDSRQQPRDPQATHVHVHNDVGFFWDYLLMRSVLSKDKKKYAEYNSKSLALGMVSVLTCIALHALVSVWYNISEETARQSEEVDYLDNKLKMFRNIELAVSATSLAALIGCAINPVLPVISLFVLGINSLVCLASGLDFDMKHKKESENIKKAEEEVDRYHRKGDGHGGYSPTAPPSSAFSYLDPKQSFQDCGLQV